MAWLLEIGILLETALLVLTSLLLELSDWLLDSIVDEELASVEDELCDDELSLLGPGVATQAESENATASKLSRFGECATVNIDDLLVLLAGKALGFTVHPSRDSPRYCYEYGVAGILSGV